MSEAESRFAYYNSSARPPIQSIRSVAEEWFQRLPRAAQPDLRSRFRSKKDMDHLGAFFELFVHELLVRVGFDVLPHPQLPGDSTRRPDFLARKSGKDLFYAEATVGASSAEAQAADARQDQVYEALASLQSPDFFLHLDVEGAPDTAPKAKVLRRQLEIWLSGLDPDQVLLDFHATGYASLPTYTWRHEGWRIRFVASPKAKEHRGKTDINPLGSRMTAPTSIETTAKIRNAVTSKSKAYSDAELPLLVAVNVIDEFSHRLDPFAALLGSWQVTVRSLPDGTTESRETRARDGAWFGPAGPRNSACSAALVVGDLLPWQIGKREPTMIHNPWARNPFQPEWIPLTQAVADLERMNFASHDGKPLAHLIGVPTEWPPLDGDEPDD